MNSLSIEHERERLKEMQNLMKQVHESVLAGKAKFDLSEWVKGKVSENTPPNECGAVCCAVGFAMQHKPFNDQGFGISADLAYDYNLGIFVSIPKYLDDTNWNAVENFFGLTNKEAEYCFSDFYYPENPTPLDVRNHIQDILDENLLGLYTERRQHNEKSN